MEWSTQEKKNGWLIQTALVKTVEAIVGVIVTALIAVLVSTSGHFWAWLVHLPWGLIGQITLYITLIVGGSLVVDVLWKANYIYRLRMNYKNIIAHLMVPTLIGVLIFLLSPLMLQYLWIWLVHLPWGLIGQTILYIILTIVGSVVVKRLRVTNYKNRNILTVGIGGIAVVGMIAFFIFASVPQHLLVWLARHP